MEMSKKRVFIRCSIGGINLSYDTALSLLLEYIKNDVVYFATDDYMTYGINLINRFIELGKETNDTITLDYNIDNQDKEIYSSIIYGLEHRMNYLLDYLNYM